MAIGDLLITVLDTTPRTVLCIETVAAPFDGTSRMEVDERPYELHGLPTVPELEQRWSITFPTDPGPVDDALADRILTAGQSHYAHYFGDIDTLDPTSTAAHRPNVDERAGQLHRLQLTDAVAKVQQQRSPSLSFRITDLQAG